MRRHILMLSEGTKRAVTRTRDWLRRIMPRVAIAAAALFILRTLLGDTRLYGEHLVGALLELVTIIVVCFTIIYYGLKGLLWLKRHLLWRVRRRLVVTYLFVGLTPIVLLVLLGLLSAFGGSSQAMARIVTAQLNASEKQSRTSARLLADALSRLPSNIEDQSIQAWLDEWTGLLQASLPGSRVAVWRGTTGEEAATLGHDGPARFVSGPLDESTRSLGDSTPPDAPLPAWLRGRAEWSGLTYVPPPDEKEFFGSPSVRSVTRGMMNGRPFTLLLVVPVSRALVHQYREITGIYIRPFFLITRTDPGNAQVNISIGEDNQGRVSLTRRQRGQDVEVEQRVAEIFNADQLGESLGKGTKYPVVLPTTNWFSGESTQNLSFLFDWSWTLASKQLLEGSRPGEVWRQALKFVGITFLALELLALFAAALMTRAVTGTVHRLYHATQLIKRGDFSHRIRVRSHDQLGELAVAFNEMSANIESLMHERVERERLQREVEIAAEVQAQLFPSRVPDLSTVEIAAECRAARGVAGDYYDYVEVASGIVALALGDVSGKGVSASLVMSNLQATLRAQTTITAERLSIAERAVAVSAGAARGTAQLLARVVADADMDGAVSRMTKNINEQLCRSTDADRFATLFLALYEDRTRTLRYTNAGHNAPILVRASGALERLTVGGVIVGAFDWAPYQEASTTLQADDLLVIYSDGISEAAGATGEEYGEERLARFVVEHRTLSADELRRALFDEINAWSGNQERDDDQTLVIVKARKR